MSTVQPVDIGTGSPLVWTPEDDLVFDDCFEGDDGAIFELTLQATDAEATSCSARCWPSRDGGPPPRWTSPTSLAAS